MCDEAGVRLFFLPPYSPDFNPIEESFAELKAWIKKNRLLVDDCQTFEEFLELGINYMANKAGNHFKRAHIVNYPEGF
jgi:transposase